jgi:hypothetical protein
MAQKPPTPAHVEGHRGRGLLLRPGEWETGLELPHGLFYPQKKVHAMTNWEGPNCERAVGAARVTHTKSLNYRNKTRMRPAPFSIALVTSLP